MDQTNDRDAEIAATITAYVAAANRGDHFDLDDLDPELRNEVEDLLPIVLGAADDDDTTEGWETSAADADEAAARFGFAPRDGTRRILGARLRELRIRSDRTPRHVAAAVSAAGATVTETDITSFENQTIAHVPDRAAAALIDLFGPAVAYGNDDAPGRASANTTESADVSAIVNWVRPDAEIAVLEVGTRSGLPVDEELNINLLGLEAHALVCSSINDVDAVALAATAAAARLFERQPQLNAVFVVAGDAERSTATFEPIDVRTARRQDGPRPPGRTQAVLNFEDSLRRFFETFVPDWPHLEVGRHHSDPPPVDAVIIETARRAVTRAKLTSARIPAKQDALASLTDEDATGLADLLEAVHGGLVVGSGAVRTRVDALVSAP
jgi:hypothetical protein